MHNPKELVELCSHFSESGWLRLSAMETSLKYLLMSSQHLLKGVNHLTSPGLILSKISVNWCFKWLLNSQIPPKISVASGGAREHSEEHPHAFFSIPHVATYLVITISLNSS